MYLLIQYHSGNNTRRDFEELFERAAETGDIESGAFSLGSLLKGLGGVVSSIFGGGRYVCHKPASALKLT